MKEARSPFPPVPPAMRLRSILTLCLLMAWLAVMLGRVFQLQVLKAEALKERAEAQLFDSPEIPAQRGRIWDADGRMLAEDAPAYSVWAYLPEAGASDALAAALAGAIEFDAEALDVRAARGQRFVPLVRKAPLAVGDALRARNIRGVHVLPDAKRVYPLGIAAAPLLGLVGAEGHGLDGLEAHFDSELAGKPGRAALTRDGRGCIIEVGNAGIPALPGKDLRLTIRAPLQQAAYDALVQLAEQYKPAAATCVLLEPSSGNLLAMASIPSYDPEDTRQLDTGNMRNRAVTDAFEPGSSFKPFVMAAALELGVVALADTWNCHNGAWRCGGRLLHDVHPYDRLDTAGIIIKSSNIGMAQVGLRIYEKTGYKGMYEAVAAFGFGSRSGLPCASETPGLLLPHTRWTSYSVTSIPMGQEIAVSPLQQSLGYAALINGGVLMSPRIVDKWEWRGKPLEKPPVSARRRVISEETSRIIRDMLYRVVEEGTGKRARIPGHSVGGKTGTAEKAQNGRYIPGKYISVFAGFTPADAPKVLCLVLVDEPHGAYYGGTVAAPAVKNILEAAIAYFGLPPDSSPTK